MTVSFETTPRGRSYDEMRIAGAVRPPYEICGMTRTDYYRWLSKLFGEKIRAPYQSQNKPVKKIVRPQIVRPTPMREFIATPKPVPRVKPVRVAPRTKQIRDELLPRIIELNRAGKTQHQIATELDMKTSTVNLWLKKYFPDRAKHRRGEKNEKLAADIMELNKRGMTQKQISETLGICRPTVIRILKKFGGDNFVRQRRGPKENSVIIPNILS